MLGRLGAAAALAFGTTGCFVSGDAGYTNRASFPEPGGVSAVIRAGSGDFRDVTIAVDTGLRVDATARGSRAAIGGDVVWLPLASFKREWTPFARAGLWLAPLRGGHAARDALGAPTLELGALFHLTRETRSRRFLTAGLRADYWSTEGASFAGATTLTAFVGYGFGTSSRF